MPFRVVLLGRAEPHTFTLILSGVAELTHELADALYAATQGDIELNLRDGRSETGVWERDQRGRPSTCLRCFAQ